MVDQYFPGPQGCSSSPPPGGQGCSSSPPPGGQGCSSSPPPGGQGCSLSPPPGGQGCSSSPPPGGQEVKYSLNVLWMMSNVSMQQDFGRLDSRVRTTIRMYG